MQKTDRRKYCHKNSSKNNNSRTFYFRELSSVEGNNGCVCATVRETEICYHFRLFLLFCSVGVMVLFWYCRFLFFAKSKTASIFRYSSVVVLNSPIVFVVLNCLIVLVVNVWLLLSICSSRVDRCLPRISVFLGRIWQSSCILRSKENFVWVARPKFFLPAVAVNYLTIFSNPLS